MAQILGPAQAPPTPKQILQENGDALRAISEAAVDPQWEMERVVQLNKAWRNWRMVKGQHFLVPGLVDSPFGEIVDYVGVADGDNSADSKLLRPINVVGGDCYKFQAVMGNSAPRVKAVADDPEDPDSIDKAKSADAVLRDLWQKWEADQKQRVMAFHQYTTGPTYWRTTWVTDRAKYGQTVEPNVQVQDDPNGGPPLPVPGPPHVYINGDVELQGFTVLEVSHPYMAKSLGECAYFTCEVMRSKWSLLDLFGGKDGEPGPLDQYRTTDPPDDNAQTSNTVAAQAAEAVSNPSGTGRPKRSDQWRFREQWFPSWMYESIAEADVRAMFKQQFPDGLYLAKVEGLPVAIENRKLTDEWAVCKTGRGEKIIEDPICADAIPIQMTINDLFGLAVETVLRAIAKTIVDVQLLDRESLKKNDAAAAEIILTAMPADGSDLSKHVTQVQTSRLSDQVVPLITTFRTQMQDITGIRPELSGGGATTNTYREAKQRKDQALLQLSPQAQEMQYCWQDIGKNGVGQRARFGSGTIKVPRRGSFGAESDVVDLAELSEGGWHTEADDNFPMNSADRFDKMWAVLKDFGPEIQKILGVFDPINLEETLELLQIPGFNSVSEEQKKKTLSDISQLLQGSPVQGQPGPDGSTVPDQPSIAIDEYDDHAFVADFVRKWCVSQTGQKNKTNAPDGFANVLAWRDLHQQAANPTPPPPPPPVRAALNASVKLEDMPPQFANEILQGAGLPAMSIQPKPQPLDGMPTPQSDGPPSPAPPESTPSAPPSSSPPIGSVEPPSKAPDMLS